jgi:hypothetical protein
MEKENRCNSENATSYQIKTLTWFYWYGNPYVDEYSPTLHYVEGSLNVIADTFSILSCLDDTSALVGKKAITEDSNSASYSIYDDDKIFNCLVHLPCLTNRKKRKSKLKKRKRHDQCYLNLPEDILEENPLDIENIKEKQAEDNDLQQSVIRHPEWFSHKTLNEVTDMLCYTKPGDDPANWKIALSSELINPTIRWYHQVTGHPGSKILNDLISK